MGKISYENKKGKVTIENRISYPEAVNEQIFKVQSSAMLPNVVAITKKEKSKETKLTCTVQGMQTLAEYFSGIVAKRKFLETIDQIIFIIKTYEKNMINPNNLDLQKDRIFLNPETKEMKCIYWPVVNNQNEVPVQAFFQQLPVGVTFDTFEDTAYLYEYSNFFNKVAPFSLKEFEKLILKLQGKKDVGGKVAPSESLNPKTNVPQKKQEDNIAYDPFSAVKQVENNEDGYTTCVNCNTPLKKTAKFCSSCGAQQVKQQDKVVPKPDPIPAPKPEPTPVNDEVNLTQFVQANNGGGTVVLSFDNDVKLVPKLVSERMNNRFVINNPVFRIGSEAGSDLVISDNKYISRKHMEIVTQNDRYYAVDKGSTNKSYVSGKELTPNVAFEIFHNTEIKLANEVFTFVIEA